MFDVCVAAVLIGMPLVIAAPSPDPDNQPKEQLQNLGKRLPHILNEWIEEEENVTWLPHEPNKMTCNPKLRLLRRVSSHRAKAVILLAASQNGTRNRDYDVLLTVFLTYYDGFWTTEQFELAYNNGMRVSQKSFSFLILAIDELAEERPRKEKKREKEKEKEKSSMLEEKMEKKWRQWS